VGTSVDWEVFGGWRSSEKGALRVTLRRDRRLILNTAAYDLLGRPAEVVLLYSATRRAIGIRPTSDDTGRIFRVRQEGKGTRYSVDAAPFIRYYGIDHSWLTVFEAVQLEDGILILPLEQARRRGPSPSPNGE
jgi:hypothetical protein